MPCLAVSNVAATDLRVSRATLSPLLFRALAKVPSWLALMAELVRIWFSSLPVWAALIAAFRVVRVVEREALRLDEPVFRPLTSVRADSRAATRLGSPVFPV